jgi:hypothetical protein
MQPQDLFGRCGEWNRSFRANKWYQEPSLSFPPLSPCSTQNHTSSARFRRNTVGGTLSQAGSSSETSSPTPPAGEFSPGGPSPRIEQWRCVLTRGFRHGQRRSRAAREQQRRSRARARWRSCVRRPMVALQRRAAGRHG